MRIALLAVLVGCSGSSSTTGTLPVDPPNPPPTAVSPQPPAATKPWPATRTGAVSDGLHGQKVSDPYRWLESETAPEVQAWMKAQDEYARGELAKLPGRAELVERLKKLFYYDAISAPQVAKGGRMFYARKHADKEKKVVYWKQGPKGTEQVMFDPNTWSTDGSAGLGGWWPSRDGKYVAYSKKQNNSDETVTYVRDVGTGKDLPDVIEGTKYASASWAPDGKGFYYTWLPPISEKVAVADRPGFAEVRFHKLGTDPSTDAVIREATKNPQTFINGTISFDGHWLLVEIQHGWSSTDVYFKDARKPAAAWTPLVEKVDASFTVTAWRDQFYVMTNDGAPKYRVYKVDPKKPARASWKEIVPETEATLEKIELVGGKLVLGYLRNASSEISVHELDGKLARKIELPALVAADGIVGNPDGDIGYVAYTSFTLPSVVLEVSVKTGKATEWARVTLPIDTSGMETEQVFYPSKDGTKISMFIIKPRGATKNGKNPTILYGYGGFNVSLLPGFASSRAMWIEKGGIYAIPNLRGGGEYGEAWHRAGMLLNKQNVFDDFIGAAEYLVKEGWTSSAHLAVSGGSNGGLLVGAVMTQRPDLFKAVVCAVPLLDMLRYHLFGSGKTWVPEYGSADDPAQYKALYAYSPYRLAVDGGPKQYPALLMDSADHDDRVDPLHARKFAALIQANQTADAPVLLRIEKNAGHGGADMVKQQVERTADQIAWLSQLLQ